MILILDIFLFIFIFIIVIMILCGFFSLCERKVLAMFHLRIGPGLFLFGLTSPITDGIKLILKFLLFIVHFDIFYFICSLLVTILCMYSIWFIIPLGYLIIFETNFTIFLILSIHAINLVSSVIVVGAYLFTSCFIYLAFLRTTVFSILGELCLQGSIYTIFVLEFFSFLSIKDMCVSQIFISNYILVGFIFMCIFCLLMLLDCSKLPFDYMECESELVAGLVTEFSGLFFIIYSLLEINHVLLSSFFIIALCWGGIHLTIKALMIILILFLIPRSICCRLKVTTAQSFLLNFILLINVSILFWFFFTKLLIVLL